MTVLLRREGWRINRKRVHRIWEIGRAGITPEKTEEAQDGACRRDNKQSRVPEPCLEL
ncbi:MAG: hypothetical protein CL875_05270 [Dehalococcoidales bacterium]|nr:hypothetical protein [Dehalococcoidales bacterium]